MGLSIIHCFYGRKWQGEQTGRTTAAVVFCVVVVVVFAVVWSVVGVVVFAVVFAVVFVVVFAWKNCPGRCPKYLHIRSYPGARGTSVGVDLTYSWLNQPSLSCCCAIISRCILFCGTLYHASTYIPEPAGWLVTTRSTLERVVTYACPSLLSGPCWMGVSSFTPPQSWRVASSCSP